MNPLFRVIKNHCAARPLYPIFVMVFLFSLLIGCTEKTSDQQAEIIASTPSQPLTLPISLNELMVALVNQAADPIWVADWKNPQTEKEWRNLEYLAYQLQVGGDLLTIPGTGPLDKTWTDNPQWQEFSQRLADVGRQALAAVESRDHAAIRLAGDDIVEVCEDCHKVFKPDIPTGQRYGELSPTE